MNFLLDICASSRKLRATLTELGHQVNLASDYPDQREDAELMALALHNGWVLVTLDKDFGELIFVQHLSHGCIVRLVEMTVSEQCSALRDLLDNHSVELSAGVLIVIDRFGVRFRGTDLAGLE